VRRIPGRAERETDGDRQDRDEGEAGHGAMLRGAAAGHGVEVLASAHEALEADGEALGVGSPEPLARRVDRRSVEALEHVEHRPVVVLEETCGDMDAEIRRHADEILVERAVVDRAEAQPVRHDRLTQLFCVPDDVRRVEQA